MKTISESKLAGVSLVKEEYENSFWLTKTRAYYDDDPHNAKVKCVFSQINPEKFKVNPLLRKNPSAIPVEIRRKYRFPFLDNYFIMKNDLEKWNKFPQSKVSLSDYLQLRERLFHLNSDFIDWIHYEFNLNFQFYIYCLKNAQSHLFIPTKNCINLSKLTYYQNHQILLFFKGCIEDFIWRTETLYSEIKKKIIEKINQE